MRIIAVMSNKGGVGKTTISINLAYALAAKGRKTGLLDIDFHGPTLPTILGVKERPRVTVDYIEPVEVDGVKVMSIAMLLRRDDDPVLWSAETKRRMVVDMIRGSVNWGDVEYLVADTPPSLSDENLLVADMAEKIILVTTPHPASIYDIRKMLRFLGAKVAAIVVNMVDLFGDVDEGVFNKPVYKVEFSRDLQVNPRVPHPEVLRLVEEVVLDG